MKKQRGGILSDVQKSLIKSLQSVGYVVIVAKGCADAQIQLEQFMKDTP